jgi:hypothetical protein
MADIGKDQAINALKAAKRFIEGHKQTFSELKKGVEGLGAAMLCGLAEGRLAGDGSGHVQIAGVPVDLLAGGLALAGAATPYFGSYREDAGNFAAGLLGKYGGELGTQLGLTMRAKAGHPTQMALLPPGKALEINEWAKAHSKQVIEAPLAGYRIGMTGEFAPMVGAAPGALSPERMEAMIREAQAAQNQ